MLCTPISFREFSFKCHVWKNFDTCIIMNTLTHHGVIAPSFHCCKTSWLPTFIILLANAYWVELSADPNRVSLSICWIISLHDMTLDYPSQQSSFQPSQSRSKYLYLVQLSADPNRFLLSTLIITSLYHIMIYYPVQQTVCMHFSNELTQSWLIDWMLTGSKLNFSFQVNYSSSSWRYFVEQNSTQVELIVFISCQLTPN